MSGPSIRWSLNYKNYKSNSIDLQFEKIILRTWFILILSNFFIQLHLLALMASWLLSSKSDKIRVHPMGPAEYCQKKIAAVLDGP